MNKKTTVRKAFTGDHVQQYDQKTLEANWLDPDIVFGLTYRYINPGESILDVGIGTGLSSILFHRAGLEVHGLDFSSEMLEVCAQKAFTASLTKHDVSAAPYPLKDNSVNHAVSTGLTHLFSNLETFFYEVHRTIKQDGVFSFVVADSEKVESCVLSCQNNNNSKVKFHYHSQKDLNRLFQECGFEQLNSLKFSSSSIGRQERTYRAYVVQKL